MNKRSSNPSLLKHLDFLIIDLLCLAASFFASYLIKLKSGIQEFNSLYLTIFLWMIFSSVFYYVVFNPYKNILRRDVWYEFQSSFLFVAVNAISVFTVLYAFKVGWMYSRTQLAYTYLIVFVVSTFVRIVWKKHLISVKSENKIGVFVIVEKKHADSVVFNIENSEFSEYLIKGIYLVDSEQSLQINEYKVYSRNDDIVEKVLENNVLEVLAYCDPVHIKVDVIKKILENGIQFHIGVDKIFEFEPDEEEINNLAMYRTLSLNSFSFSPIQILYDPIKRLLDILISLFACLFLLPIYLFVKFSYLLDGDHEPILYTHTRIGKNGKEFKLYKFRSMIPNADDVLKEMLKDAKYKAEWDKNHKFDDDPRITKIGNFIRKTSIDEFPQFINVLKGDMAIIGPRPLVPGELKEKNGLSLYERIKPGITGWWACNGRSSISYEERLELEYYYVKNYSLALDIMCILKTIYVVLFRKGAK